MDLVTVTQISSLFHNFEQAAEEPKDEQSRYKTLSGSGSRPSRALKLATISNHNTSKRHDIQKKMGIDDESRMLDKYELMFGRTIKRRNDETLKLNLRVNDRTFCVTGRIDGFIEDESIVVEHKRRTRGLMSHVPYHECVQCHLYMKMTNSKLTHLIETFGEHMKVHELKFDDKVWKYILSRWFMLSDFIFSIK